ncbi:MAG: hypothetical protein ACRDQZ_25550 [Mycobacteriales bacterium]
MLFVDGILAAEEPDFEDEIMDYKSSKPNFKAWNANFAEMTSGKSVGNLRGQHNSKICGGTFVQMEYNDDEKTIPVTAKVIDPVEQDKVRHGAYTSFSIGAHYAKKWRDGKYMRWTADPFEGSLVDFGAIPKSRGINYRSADGKEEFIEFDGGRRILREAYEALGKPLSVAQEDKLVDRLGSFKAAEKGLYGVAGFAQLLQQLIYMRDALIYERETEGDESPVTDRVMEATGELLECLAAYTQEQVSEEIGKTNSETKGAKTVEIKELLETAKNTPGADLKTETKTAAAAGSTDTPNDNVAFKAAVTQLEDVVKQAGKLIEMAKAGQGACAKSAADCQDEKCATHKAEKAAAKCDKSAEDCADDKCMTHKGKAAAADEPDADDKSKAAAAGSGAAEVALKRADIEAIVEKAVKAQVEAGVVKALEPFGEQLGAIGEALKAIGGAPAPTRIAARPGLKSVSKDEEEADRYEVETEETADKAVRSDVKEGKTVSAIMRIRERPKFVTTGGGR